MVAAAIKLAYPAAMLGDELEQAFLAFEQVTGVHVVLHDFDRRWWMGLSPPRARHFRPICRAVKASAHAGRCEDLELAAWQGAWRDWPEGRVHRCHAGLIEWVVPIHREGVLLGSLFAGQALLAEDATPDHEQRASGAEAMWRDAVEAPPVIDRDGARRTLELLRQLAARLLLWSERAPALRAEDRVRRIRRFIQDRHSESDLRLADLARSLGLSEGRTAHVLRAELGASFVELLTAARLRSAAAYLRATSLPVGEVALAAGFGDASRFHKVFKRALGTTPLRYRRETVT